MRTALVVWFYVSLVLISILAIQLRRKPSSPNQAPRSASTSTVALSEAPVRKAPVHLAVSANAETYSTGPIYRVGVLRRFLEAHRNLEIPEFQYLSDEDWLFAASKVDPENEASIRLALSNLRMVAKQELLPLMKEAMAAYKVRHGQFPSLAEQLKEIIREPDIESVLNRYHLESSNDTWSMKETVILDSWYDFSMAFDGSSASFHAEGIGIGVEQAYSKFVSEHKREPLDPSEIKVMLPADVSSDVLKIMFYASKKRRSA